MTLLFAGDTHGDQRWLGRIAARVRPAALVHLGDIQLEEPAEVALGPVFSNTRFLWVAGNHDYDTLDYHQRLQAPVLAAGALHRRVIVVDGVRIAGLGGWFKSRVWRPPQPPEELRRPGPVRTGNPQLQLEHIRELGAIWWEDYEALWRQRADVLVCHEAPSCHRHGFQAIDDLALGMGVSRIFHGHHHETYQAQVGGIRVFGVGLRAIVDLDGKVIHPGEEGKKP